MQNFLKFLLFFLLVITSCENTEEHQPSGTNQWTTTLSKSGTMLMVFDTDYFWCHLNDVLVVWGESYEVAFDIVNIFHWGKNSAYFDNLRVYNSNAVTMEIINDNKSIKLPFPY